MSRCYNQSDFADERAIMMNPELLTCKRFTAGIIYPPLQLKPVDLNRLYAAITERYPYQTFQHLPDGARMANPEGDCFVQQTRMQVNETVINFRATKEKSMDVFRIIHDRLRIPQFLTFGIKLTAFLPFNQPPEGTEFMENRVLAAIKDKLELLGDGRQGSGLRVILHRDGIHEVRIEPFFNDLSQLYVEVDVQHPTPFKSLSEVETKMEAVYNYMFGEVARFIGSFG